MKYYEQKAEEYAKSRSGDVGDFEHTAQFFIAGYQCAVEELRNDNGLVGKVAGEYLEQLEGLRNE